MRARATLAAVVLAATCVAGGCQPDDQGALSIVITTPDHDLSGASKATLLVDYSGTGARLLSSGGGPVCAFIMPGADGDFSDDGRGTLTITTRGTRAPRALTDIAACRMKPGDPDATAADLQAKISVRVGSAEDISGKEIDIADAVSKKAHRAARIADQSGVETAQADAVRAAEKAFPPKAKVATSVPGPDGGDPAIASAGKGAVAGSGGLSAAEAAAGMAAAAALQQQQAANAARSVAAMGQGSQPPPASDDPSAVPVDRDQDPSYDDSPSDDERAPAYNLDITVQGEEPFGALQFEMTHLGNNGGFIGHGDSIDCVPLVEAIVAGNYVGERVAKIGLISLQGIDPGLLILRCGFRTREALSPASFLIEVTDAANKKSEPLDPPPTVAIASVMRR